MSDQAGWKERCCATWVRSRNTQSYYSSHCTVLSAVKILCGCDDLAYRLILTKWNEIPMSYAESWKQEISVPAYIAEAD